MKISKYSHRLFILLIVFMILSVSFKGVMAQQKGILEISSMPSNAKVYINNEFKGYTPLTLFLRPGMYRIKIVKEEFETYTKTIFLDAGQIKEINAVLISKFGFITITSIPTHATIYIDGKYIGQAPIMNHKISTGTHKITASVSGITTTQVVNVNPGNLTSVEIKLPLGYLNVYSNIPNAKVYIDGEYVGKTPIKNHIVPTGTHEIKVILETVMGKVYYSTRLNVNLLKTYNINANLQAGILSITSSPPEASVVINDRNVCRTPCKIIIPEGTYTIRVTKPEYEDYITKVTVTKGGTKEVSVSLIAKYGFLTVECNVPDAKVYIDGEYVGNTPITRYKLSTGTHKIEVLKENYARFSTTVNINPFEEAKCTVSLHHSVTYYLPYVVGFVIFVVVIFLVFKHVKKKLVTSKYRELKNILDSVKNSNNYPEECKTFVEEMLGMESMIEKAYRENDLKEISRLQRVILNKLDKIKVKTDEYNTLKGSIIEELQSLVEG